MNTPLNVPVDRRNLLKGGFALGLSSLFSSALLSACGGGSEEAQPTESRETRTLQFDLSAAPIAEPKLQLPRSAHNGTPLLLHTAATRAAHRAKDPLLNAVPDQQLTHYLEDVDLPARALQHGTVIGKDPKTGAAVLALSFIHVPSASRASVQAKRAKTPLVSRQPNERLQAPPQLGGDFAPPPIGVYSSALQVAQTLVFQHPAITNLNPDLGADILDRITSLPDPSMPYLWALTYQVAVLMESGYPSTTSVDSWAVLVPRRYPDGTPVLDDDGEPVYSYTINPALAPYAATVVKQILNNINDDSSFAGSNWQPSMGAPQQGPVAAAAAALFAAPAAADSGPPPAFGITHTLTVGSRTSGIRFKDIAYTNDRNVSLTVSNEFLRSAGAFVQFFDANDKALDVENPADLDTPRSKYLALLAPDVQIMGVPLLGDWAPTTTFNFTMPPAASKAVVYYGGLGLGGSDWGQGEAFLGAISTLVINFGLPAACLAFGVYEMYEEGLGEVLKKAMQDPVTVATVAKGVVEALGDGLGSDIQTATTTLSMAAFLGGIGETVLDIFLQCCPRISTLLAAAIANSSAQKAIPIVGQALWMLSTIAEVATISETLIEVICSAPIDKNVITLTMPQKVVLSRDPNDYQFPATATSYRLIASYDGQRNGKTFEGPITQGSTGPLTLDLGTVSSGGFVQIQVFLLNDRQCIVGHGRSSLLTNMPDTAGSIPITITEYLIPLDANTVYQHSSKLVYQNGAHAWSAGSAPTQTVTSLRPGADNALGALHDITVHTESGMAGYAFAAGGQGLALCGGVAASSVSSLRNVFLGDAPDSAAKFSSCGAAQPMGIVYEAHSAVHGGNNFFLQPGSDNYFHLRSVSLDNSNFDMGQSTSWGRFSYAQDSLCVLSNGFVVGVNRDTHKMEVLTLPQAPDKPSYEIDTVPFSALKLGYGSQVGQLDTPIAVCAFGEKVLVLEQGNQRVQAFDQDGSAINLFADATGKAFATPIMALKDASTEATYLDIAVEGLGYIYVLWHEGDGGTAADYHLDLYTPSGAWLSRTSGMAAGALAVDLFRNVYTLNYETIAGAPVVEPSLSQWLPHSTSPCGGLTSAVQSRGFGKNARVAVCAAAL